MKQENADQDFERLLEFLRAHRGFDFTGYKRTSLARRIRKRMDQVGVASDAEYVDYLQIHPEEFALLFNTILINVTSFFRDPPAWQFLTDQVLPRIINGKERFEPIRVWSAGCATGQEAYSAAMLLAEALGTAEFRDRVKIYATDVDEDALSRARHGLYAEQELKEVSPELREKYFETTPTGCLFRSELRRALIFGRHDLVQDAPISRIDLLICRNTLMYFEPEAQGRILARLHYALNERGFLLLGRAEMLLTRDSLFTPVDLKQRVFTKVPRVGLRDRLVVMAQAGTLDPPHGKSRSLRELVNDFVPLAQMAVDTGGYVVGLNDRARKLFGLVSSDLGRPLQDLEVSYRPLELRGPIEQALADRGALEFKEVQRTFNGRFQYLDVRIDPVLDPEAGPLGVVVSFNDVTNPIELQRELERSKHELETASEELQSTNEELETTNEELQSTVEELETTNEELQSSNEELETMNEELESTNSELQAINNELHQRSDQIDELNEFMERVLANLRVGVVVLDGDMRVIMWNRRSQDLWGLRDDEVIGQPLLSLDIGLPVKELAQPINDVLREEPGFTEVMVDSTNRRGRKIQARVQVSRMPSRDRESAGVILVIEESNGEAPPPVRLVSPPPGLG